MKKTVRTKKVFAMLLALIMLVGNLPITALADSISYADRAPSDFIYYWNGEQDNPGHPTLEELYITGKSAVAVHKYQLANTQDATKIWAYCSDRRTPPVDNSGSLAEKYMYQRIPLEQVEASDGFFNVGGLHGDEAKAEVLRRAAKLRAILMNSDLYTGEKEIDLSQYSSDVVIASVQAAVWNIVNGDTYSRVAGTAYADPAVRELTEALLALDPVYPDQMAQIKAELVQRYMDGGKNQAEIQYAITGANVDGDNVDADIGIEVYWVKGAQKTLLTKDTHYTVDTTNGIITLLDIQAGSGVELTLTTTQTGVDSVYLFAPPETGNTQTMVGIMTEDVPLKTTITLDPMGGLGSVEFFKYWVDNKGALLANNAVKDYKATFSITYATGKLAGVKVVEDLEITGHGSAKTADIFAQDILYKITEESFDAKDKTGDTTKAEPKYFMIDSNRKVVWTDETGKAKTGPVLNRFDNVVAIGTGSLKVTKNVTGAGAPTGDTFTFVIEYSVGGGNPVPYANETYALSQTNGGPTSVTTNEHGHVTLNKDQSATFTGLPAGYTMTVREIDTNNGSYEMPDPVTVVIEEIKTQDLVFTNEYRVGELTITKNFVDLDDPWAAFPNANSALKITVKSDKQGGPSYSVQLYKGHESEILTLPVGSYTVTEDLDSAKVSGYEVAVTIAGDGKVTIGKDDKKTVALKNEYTKVAGSLEIEKLVDISSELSSTVANSINGKTFTFKLYEKNGSSYKQVGADITVSAGEKKLITGLAPGTYYIEETGATIGEANLNILCGVEPNEKGYYAVEVKKNETAAVKITNKYTKLSGSVKVTKDVAGDLSESYFKTAEVFTFTVTDEDNKVVATFALPSANNSWSYTVDNLAPGKYTVTETGHAEPAHYKWSVSNQGKVEVTVKNGSEPTEATIINTYTRKTADVSFTKVVDGYDAGDSFSFKVVVSGSGKDYDVSIEDKNGKVRAGTMKNGIIAGVMNGDVVTIKDLPEGATVTITETEESSKFYKVTPAAGHTFVVEKDGGTKTFTNKPLTTSFSMEKVLKNASWDVDFKSGIQFKITGPNGWYEQSPTLPKDIVFTKVDDSTYTFWVTSSDILYFKDMLAGKYTITELTDSAGKANHGRKTEILVQNIDVAEYETVLSEKNPYAGVDFAKVTTGHIIFTNTYGQGHGTLEIVKDVKNNVQGRWFKIEVVFDTALTTDQINDLEVTAGEKSGQIVSKEGFAPSYTTKDGVGVYTFYITDAGYYSLINVPAGTKCTVTETSIVDSGATTTELITQYDVTYGDNKQTTTVNLGKTERIVIINERKMDTEVTIEKIVANDDGNADAQQSFEFTVTVDAAWSGKYRLNGTVYDIKDNKITLKDGEVATLIGMPRGATVTVIEVSHSNYSVKYQVNGNAVVEGNPKATVETSSSAAGTEAIVFTNTRKTVAELKVTKKVDGTAAELYANTLFTFTLERGGSSVGVWEYKISGAHESRTETTLKTNAQGQFTLYGGEIAAFTGLPMGSYAVKEDIAAIKQDLSPNIEFTPPQEKISISSNGWHATVLNTFDYKLGELTVTKAVERKGTGSWEDFDAKTYTFVLKDGNGNLMADHAYKGVPYTNDKGEFEITVDVNDSTTNSVTIKGLRNGDYYVDEVGVENLSGYDVTVVTGTGATHKQTVSNTAQTTPVITVTNTYTREMGGLEVTKTVKTIGGTAIEATKSFNLILYSNNGTPNDTTDDKIVSGVKYTVGSKSEQTLGQDGKFALTHSETAVFTNLPTGNYYVVEEGATVDGYSLKVTGNEAAVLVEKGADPVPRIEVKNTYTRDTGNLTITKKIGEDSALEPADWSFDFVITAHPDDYTGATTFTLTDNDPTKELNGIPTGEYTITETAVSPDGYRQVTEYFVGNDKVNSSALAGTVEVGKDATVAVTVVNAYRIKGAFLTLNKDFANVTPQGIVEFTIKQDGGPVERTVTLDSNGWSQKVELPVGTYLIQEVAPIEIPNYTFLGVSYWMDLDGEQPLDELDDSWFNNGWLEVVIEDGEDITVTALNSYHKDAGVLKVTKQADNSYTSSQNVFEFTLEVDPSQGFFPKTYTVLDADGNVKVTPTAGADGIFTLCAGETAVFEGIDPGIQFTVTETAPGSYFALSGIKSYTYTYTLEDAGVAYAERPAAAEETVAAEAIDAGTNSITKTMGAKNVDGTYPVWEMVFSNKRETGKMSVEKLVVGPEYDDNGYKLFVTFYDDANFENESILQEIVDTGLLAFSINDEPVVLDTDTRVKFDFLNNCIVLILNKGDKADIKGIPSGVRYAVDEDVVGNYFKKGIVYSDADRVIGDGESKVDACTVTNTRVTNEMSVTKMLVSNEEEDQDKLFDFELIFTSAAGWDKATIFADNFEFSGDGVGTVETDFSEDGKQMIVTFSLSHTQYLRIKEIPAGTEYKFREVLDETDKNIYSVRYMGEDGVVDAPGEDVKLDTRIDRITVTNYNIPKNSLIIQKDVKAMEGSDLLSEYFGFTLTLQTPEKDTALNQELIDNKIIKLEAEQKQLLDELSELEQSVAQAEQAYEAENKAGYVQALSNLNNALKELEELVKKDADGNYALQADELALVKDQAEAGFEAADSYEIPCTECDGDGKVDDTEDCGSCLDMPGDCSTCEGVGKITEEDLETGETTTTKCFDCDGTGDCDECGGDGKVDILVDCPNATAGCDEGTVTVSEGDAEYEAAKNQAKAAAVANAVAARIAALVKEIEDAQKAFNEEPDVIVYNALEELKAELAGLKKKLENLDAVLGLLRSKVDVVYDEDYNIDGTANPMVGVEVELSQLTLRDKDGKVDDLTKLRWTADAEETGVYTFYLKHEQELIIENLPIGALYTVKETDFAAAPGEEFEGCKINDQGPVIVNGEFETENAGVIGVAPNPTFVHYLNMYKDPLGELHVEKVWRTPPRQGITSITVHLLLNGDIVDTIVIIPDNNGDWKGTFTGLKLGDNYVYTVREDRVANYDTSYKYPGSTAGQCVVLSYEDREGNATITNYIPDEPSGPKDPEKPEKPEEPEEPGETDTSVDIEEPEIPLVPSKPEEVEIFEEEVPKAEVPSTGDASLLGMMAAMLLSGGGLLGMLAPRKKNEDEQ